MKRDKIINSYIQKAQTEPWGRFCLREKIEKATNMSVVIPAYNEEQFLPKLLYQLKKQTYHHFEVIVVDNASTDDTYKMAQSFAKRVNYSLYVVLEEQPGVVNARARGCGEVLMRLRKGGRKYRPHILVSTDADVLPSSDWLAKINQKFKRIGTGALAGTYEASPRIDKEIEKHLGIKKFFNFLPELIEFLYHHNVGRIKMFGPNSAFEIEAYAAGGGFYQEKDKKTGKVVLNETDRLGKRLTKSWGRIIPMETRVMVSKRRQLYEIISGKESYFPLCHNDTKRFFTIREDEDKLLKMALRNVSKERWLAYRQKMLTKVLKNILGDF